MPNTNIVARKATSHFIAFPLIFLRDFVSHGGPWSRFAYEPSSLTFAISFTNGPNAKVSDLFKRLEGQVEHYTVLNL